MKTCGRVGMYFGECLNCSLEKEVSGNSILRRLYLLLTNDTYSIVCWKGKRGEVHTEFWWGNLRERHHLEDPDVDGRIILIGSSGSGMGGMDWIYRNQNKDRWWSLVNAVMNLRASKNAGNFLTS
jgi:hypothetical protein